GTLKVQPSGAGYFVSYTPARHDEPDFTLIFSNGGSSSYSITISPSSRVSGPFWHSIWGEDRWPTDGGPAMPGGTPGTGGSGGQLTVYSDALVQGSLAGHVDLGGGDPGARAANQPGGDPGMAALSNTFSTFAGWSDGLVE